MGHAGRYDPSAGDGKQFAVTGWTSPIRREQIPQSMMHDKPVESDWKAFRAMVPELRERYLKERNRELVAVLTDESLTPTERFWNTSERIEQIAKLLRTCLDGHTRSRMVEHLLLMYRYRMLNDDDLGNFSPELRSRVVELSKFRDRGVNGNWGGQGNRQI